MRICMVTPHVPPQQAANALLPVALAEYFRGRGDTVDVVSHPAADEPDGPSRPDVRYVPRRGRGPVGRTLAGAAVAAIRMAWGARRAVARADVVHLHSNGLIVEVGHALARRHRTPSVVTLYGTDIWHHDPGRHARFGRVVREAAHRVFYSRGLRDFARPRRLAPEPSTVVYAPVADDFRPVPDDARRRLRASLGLGGHPLLVTVKRLHPVAGHADLLQAMPAIVRVYPEVVLACVGDGELRSALEAEARARGLGRQVRFLGAVDNRELRHYYAAADLMVLPSRLESWGTVMLEALACGTRVVATETAGGREVHEHFTDDVILTPCEQPAALAAAVVAALGRGGRAGAATRRVLERFTMETCGASYRAIFQRVVAG